MKRHVLATAAAFAVLAFPAFAQTAATAVLMDQSNISLGTLELTEMEGGIHITGELTGVPNGDHGIHIHETGMCDTATQFETAGAHYEPGEHKHGAENPDGPHAGDLRNITADDDGEATVDLQAEGVTLAELVEGDGSAIVLHSDPDDYKTDPSGNSGDRFACGIIEGAQ